MPAEQSVLESSLIAKRRRDRSSLPTLGSKIFVSTVVVTLLCLAAIWFGVDRGLSGFAIRSSETRLHDAGMSLDAVLELHQGRQLDDARSLAAEPSVAALTRLTRNERATPKASQTLQKLGDSTGQDLVVLFDEQSNFVTASRDIEPRQLGLRDSAKLDAVDGTAARAITRIGGRLALVTKVPVQTGEISIGSILCAKYITQNFVDSLNLIVGTDITIVVDKRVAIRSGSLSDRELSARETAELTKVSDVSGVHRLQLAGTETFAVAKPISPNARFVLSQSTGALLELYDKLRGWLLPAIVLIVLATLVLSRQISRRLASPISELATVANRVAGGQLDASVPMDARTIEIARLQDAFVDMTSRLRALLEDVQNKNETLATQRDELARSNRAKSNFLATASHELRTPISSIRSFSEILLAGDADDEPEETRNEFLGIIRGESERLARLVEQLLDLATIESGVASWSNEDVDLGEIAEKTLRALAGLGAAQDVTLTLSGREAGSLPYRGDPDRLQQTITNLVGNAVKFSPKGGAVEVNITRDSFGYLIRVDDEGPGVPEAERGRIFEKFVQSEDILTDKPHGSGLGLAIVREIVQVHGGRCRCDAAPSGGARFVARLPEPHAMRPLERFVAEAQAAAEAALEDENPETSSTETVTA